MKFASKRDLLERIEREHQALVELLTSIARSRYREAAVWGDGWTIQDLLAHLMEWEQMFLGWFRAGRSGGSPALPAPGYKWNETPRLNRAIWRKHHRESTAKVVGGFEASYQELLSLVRELSPEELLRPGHFAWTGKHPLTTYLGANSCSHYRFATQILKRWLKRQDAKGGVVPASKRRSLNARWHKSRRMPLRASLEARIEWHLAHAAACACRDVPAPILRELKARGITLAARTKPGPRKHGHDV